MFLPDTNHVYLCFNLRATWELAIISVIVQNFVTALQEASSRRAKDTADYDIQIKARNFDRDNPRSTRRSSRRVAEITRVPMLLGESQVQPGKPWSKQPANYADLSAGLRLNLAQD
jgi:hypothetical protein